jgi:hypothetical protein
MDIISKAVPVLGTPKPQGIIPGDDESTTAAKYLAHFLVYSRHFITCKGHHHHHHY